MKSLIFILVVLVGVLFFCRKWISRKLQAEYEKFLVRGNKRMAVKAGRIYYHTLHPEKKKAKGVVNIDKKILEDFKAFNSIYML